jgi:hypothetical protein
MTENGREFDSRLHIKRGDIVTRVFSADSSVSFEEYPGLDIMGEFFGDRLKFLVLC